jgi:ABC-type branched-subunit amino acid transport system permease subunit
MPEPIGGRIAFLAALPVAIAAVAVLMWPDEGWSIATTIAGLLCLVAAAHLLVGLAGLPILALAAIAAGALQIADPLTSRLALSPATGPLAGALLGAAFGLLLAPLLAAARPLVAAGTTLALTALAAPFLQDLPLPDAAPTMPAGVALAGTVGLCLLAAQWLGTTALGGALAASRDDPQLAIATGLRSGWARCVILILAGAMAGAAGPLMALGGEAAVADLTGGGVFLSLALAGVVVIGGQGSLAGALAAALPILVLPEMLTVLAPDIPDLRLLLLLVGLLLVHLWRVDGLMLRWLHPTGDQRPQHLLRPSPR